QVELNDELNNKDEFWSKFKHGVQGFKNELPDWRDISAPVFYKKETTDGHKRHVMCGLRSVQMQH
ncbi:MAG: hypothetical protein IKH67_06925, partial [Lachnospiraceae bacterium]|nr:hypothetical protein [Lachnospiraceae bacterium]